jgi:hypothetical protein
VTEQAILDALRANLPFRGLAGLQVAAVESRGKGPLDVVISLSCGNTVITIYGEIKSACTPKLVQEIAPWLARMKAIQKDAAFALICPALSPQAQSVCAENNVDFIDLAGNVSINVPGRFVLQRVGLKGKAPWRVPLRDPFSSKSSRVLRVLLENPRVWTLKEIAQELAAETQRNQLGAWDFRISLGSASKTVRSLEEELLVRRRELKILVPEPRRGLLRWAEKYKERYRWYLRRSFKCPNPFGRELQAVTKGLRLLIGNGGFAFTGAAAAAATAPFVDLDAIEIFAEPGAAAKLRSLENEVGLAPELRIVSPYDIGVFMYAQMQGAVPVVSNLQAYLDLIARGGRDSKQAQHLLRNVIEPRWCQA